MANVSKTNESGNEVANSVGRGQREVGADFVHMLEEGLLATR